MEKKMASFICVYCPELMAMINPGEWTDCPYFRGQKLDVSNTEEAIKQIFRCHVQCDSKIQYQYFEDGQLVTALKKLGFHEVWEAAVGGDPVTRAYNSWIHKHREAFWISSFCPSLVYYIVRTLPIPGQELI